MLFRAVVLLIGFGLAVSGGVSAIAYLNLLTTGSRLMDYLNYIIKRPECYLLPIGLIMITGAIYGNVTKKEQQ